MGRTNPHILNAPKFLILRKDHGLYFYGIWPKLGQKWIFDLNTPNESSSLKLPEIIKMNLDHRNVLGSPTTIPVQCIANHLPVS